MKQKKRTNIRQNLYKQKTPIVDNEPRSPKYFNLTYIPTVLTAGKNVIKLAGNPSYLREGSALLVEVLDFNSDPIYTEVLDYQQSDGSRAIAIYIDSETPNGAAMITIVGFAKRYPNGQTVNPPDNYINVKHTFKINVANEQRNREELIFTERPSIDIEEKVISYLDVRRPTSEPTSSVAFDSASYSLISGTPVISLTGNDRFTKEHENNGVVYFDSPNNPNPILLSKFGAANATSIPYTSSIARIINDTTAILNTPYKVTDAQSVRQHLYQTFDNTSFRLVHRNTGSFEATQNRFSYGIATIEDLEPSVGDVYKIKAFVKSNGTPASEYKVVYDSLATATDLFVDTGSDELLRPIGLIRNSQHVTTYYDLTAVNGATGGTLAYNTDKLLSSIYVSYGTPLASDEYYIVSPKQQYAIDFNEDALYEIVLDIFGEVDSNNLGDFKVDVYVSGSAFDPSDNTNASYGKKVGSIDGKTRTVFRGISQTAKFVADRDGDGVVKFHITGGTWYLSNIIIRSAEELGFTPNTVKLVLPIPDIHINDRLDFKFEFYNYQSNQASYTLELFNKFFKGGNLYIGGDENILTGSLYVASTSGSGVEISGKNGSFVRSIGYDGFVSASQNLGGSAGFLLWSGSILPDSGDSYQGVGLEMYATNSAYFRFHTSPNPFLEVVVSSFLVGDTNSQFISGSGGTLEISSSDFWLQPNGDLIIGQNATILGSLSANSIATPASGPPFLSEIKSTGEARFTSASIGGFRVGSNEISSSNDQLILRADGQITGSNVLLNGGTIGGFQLGASVISSSNGNLVLSASGEITGSDVLLNGGVIGGFELGANVISSSNGNLVLRSNGEITGSLVNFNGGIIGGFELGSTIISSSNGNLVLRSNGQITGSLVLFNGGTIGGFRLGSNVISSSNGNLVLRSNGEITGSLVLFNGGTIGGFEIGDTVISSSNGNLVLSASGEITGSDVLFVGGTIGGFVIGNDIISSSNGNIVISASGEITASSIMATGSYTGSFTGLYNGLCDQVKDCLDTNGVISGSAQILTGSNIVSSSTQVSASAASTGFIGGIDSFFTTNTGGQSTGTTYTDITTGWASPTITGHNWSWNSGTGVLTFDNAGTYEVTCVIYATGAGGTALLHLAMQYDSGGGYATLVEDVQYTESDTTVSIRSYIMSVSATDKVKFQVKHTTNGLTTSGLGSYLSCVRLK